MKRLWYVLLVGIIGGAIYIAVGASKSNVFYCQQKGNRMCRKDVGSCNGTSQNFPGACPENCKDCFTATPVGGTPYCVMHTPGTTSEGCFERKVAYCYSFWWYGPKHGESTLCLPTQVECQSMHDSLGLQTSNISPCRETLPDELK